MADEVPDSTSWYTLAESSRPLEQGDILVKCPVFRPPADLKFPLDYEKVNCIEAMEQSVIVLSQSCDIKPNQKKNIDYVVVCWINRLSETHYQKDLHARLNLAKGGIYGLHLLHECPHQPWNGEQLVVSFRSIWTLPLLFLNSFAAHHGQRSRLVSPYRELLSHRFGEYFSRVAAPVDLPDIDIPGKENRTVQYLENADPETRQRILRHFADELPNENHPASSPPQETSILGRLLRKIGLK